MTQETGECLVPANAKDASAASRSRLSGLCHEFMNFRLRPFGAFPEPHLQCQHPTDGQRSADQKQAAPELAG